MTRLVEYVLARIRLVVQQLGDAYRRRRIGHAIIDGYLRRPQAEAEVGWPDEATHRMISEERW